MASVGVVIGTYGDMGEWVPFVQRASASVDVQTRPADVVKWEHSDTLQHARNHGAGSVDTDWLIFLDADDELDPEYIEQMLAVVETESGDIIQPATLGVYVDGSEDDYSVVIPKRDLAQSNYLVIGSMCRAELFFAVGGFDEYPILEDWDLWQRMVLSGGRITQAPKAIYRVHVRAGSRNFGEELHGQIYSALVNKYAAAWIGVDR